MPFKSEKQRRYLWANEPEIARDWTDTYGSRIHKGLGGMSAIRRAVRPSSPAPHNPVVEKEVIEEIMPAVNEGIMKLGFNPRFLLADQYREDAAFGGIMGADGRRAYGLGSFVRSIVKAPKKVFKAVKKLEKSPLGKIALAYLATAGMSNIGAAGGWKQASWAKPFSAQGWLNPTQVYGNVGQSLSNLTDKLGFDKVVKSPIKEPMSIEGMLNADVAKKQLTLAQQAQVALEKGVQAQDVVKKSSIIPGIPNAVLGIAGPAIGAGVMTAKQPVEEFEGGDIYAGRDEDVDYWKSKFAAAPAEDDIWRIKAAYRSAEGGRVPAQEGGLMNLGGMEKDYRNDGGFVPIGGEEKADDVPARLSRNEFVFTADAVRNAGGGDIDKGAEVMENVMKNLEAGGKVSEDSQGKGAQEMFEVSERLSEVV